MESTVCLLAKWTLKASGLFEVDSVFLIEKGACAVLEDVVFYFEGEIGHAPERVANAFVNVRKQNLVIRVVPCF